MLHGWPSWARAWPGLGLALLLLLVVHGMSSYVTLLRMPHSAAAIHHQPPAPSADRQPADLILGLTHHKTGTSQMGCMLFAIAEVAGLPKPIYMNDEARVENITQYMVSIHPAARKPATFTTGHVLWSQQCYTTNFAGETKLCPWRAPCRCKDILCTEYHNTIELGNCYALLPTVNLKILHFIRNPVHIIISAYRYHSQTPPPEDWINLEATKYAEVLSQLGVDPDVLADFGMSAENTSYGAVLRSLPENRGIQLEFWRSLPELYDMARQYTMFKQAWPSQSSNVRFEDLRSNFNRTALSIISDLYPDFDPNALLAYLHSSEVQCDPTTWSAEKLAMDPKVRAHITTSNARRVELEKLEVDLLAVEVVKEKLCELSSLLDYNNERCR